MTQPYASLHSHVQQRLNDQLDLIKEKKTLKLNQIASLSDGVFPEVIEYIHDFINSYTPPLIIEKLSLQGNAIAHLPDNFSLIASPIRYLDLHNNSIASFPSVLGECKQLEILDLSSNKLFNIPRSDFIKLSNLKVISLKENRFRYLPPVLGDLPHLHLIEVADNPLIIPSLSVIKGFQTQSADLDWVSELKQYLKTNVNLLEARLAEIEQQSLLKQKSLALGNGPISTANPATTAITNNPPSASVPSLPTLSRTKSISETKTKASKAARRMGLIIKKNEEASQKEDPDEKFNTSGSNASVVSQPDISHLSLDNPPHTASNDTSFNLTSPPIALTTTASTAPNSVSGSPSLGPVHTLQRPVSRNRSRSNTLKEIDSILEKTDVVDTEHKSGAYFRRLSTLQEQPVDETTPAIAHAPFPPLPTGLLSGSAASSRNGSLSQQEPESRIDTLKSPLPTKSASYSAGMDSPSRPPVKKIHQSQVVVQVSRKILFAFSELHSSVRRFTGFCVDKKITIKMVSLLYTTKSNIDSLVENLEIMDDNGDNIDNIVVSLHASIASFKSIMNLLSESLLKFVAKIDVCFIRMLYLTIFGSFNELHNAYRTLMPAKPPLTQANTMSSLDPKWKSLNTNLKTNSQSAAVATDTADIDEKLYQTVELATAKAQVVFSELTKAISKSALAGTNNPQSINHLVAAKVKELTAICMTSMDITKRLKTKLITIRNNASITTKKLFWDDVNSFLKAIVSTLGPVKIMIKDLPILNDARASILNLTKTTKDIPILLEVSSYGALSSSDASAAPTQPTNLFTPLSAHPSHSLSLANLSSMSSSLIQLAAPPIRTPLSAALGPAAQAIVHNNGTDSSGLNSLTSPILSPNTVGGLSTAPSQSSGQYFAKNGINPFDGLIMASKDKEFS